MAEPQEQLPANNGTVTVLGRKFSVKDFKPLMRFYNADKELTPEDRVVLAEDLGLARNITLMWTLLDTSMAFLAPTLYQRYRERGNPPVLPPGVRRPPFYKPFLSSIIATGIYFVSYYYHGMNHKAYRIAELSIQSGDSALTEQQRDSKKRMLNVWEAIEPTKFTLFAFYYYETAANPAMILQNPMSFVSSDPHHVNYFPPPEGGKIGFFGGKEHKEETGEAWEKLREANGFTTPAHQQKLEGNLLTIPDPQDEHPKDDLSVEKETKKESAWEKLRKKV